MTRQDCYELGKILKTHSFRGEYQISFNNQFEKILENSESIFADVDGLLVPFFFEYIHITTNTTAIVKFDHIHSEEQATEFVGCTLHFPKNKAKIKADTDKENLVGYQIIDSQLGECGVIEEIIEIPQNNLFRIVKDSAEYLVPANNDFIRKIDNKKQIVFTDLPEGIIDIAD